MVVLNKRDIPEVREREAELLQQIAAAAGHKRVLSISAASRENVELLMQRLRKMLQSAKLHGPPTNAEPVMVLDEEEVGGGCEVVPVERGAWRLVGTRIEKAAAMTNWDYHEAQASSRARHVGSGHITRPPDLTRPPLTRPDPVSSRPITPRTASSASCAPWALRRSSRP